MATRKQYRKFKIPGHTTRYERNVPQAKYGEYYDQHHSEIIGLLRDAGYNVTKKRAEPQARAYARAAVNKQYNHPRQPSEWNMYVAQNIRHVMDAQGVQAKDAMRILGAEWREMHGIGRQVPVAAGISGGRKPRKLRRM